MQNSFDASEIRHTFFFFKDFTYLFLERGKHQYVVASHTPPTGDLAHNPGVCPDWELNQQPFGLQTRAQSTEPHRPGRAHYFWRILQDVL